MFSQFQARYPMGSLVSELLQIHDGHYVVRAMVQVGGVTLATGMAAATTLEQAEDQARARTLAVLGIQPMPYELQAQLMVNPSAEARERARLNPVAQPKPREQSDSLFEPSFRDHELDWSVPEDRQVERPDPDSLPFETQDFLPYPEANHSQASQSGVTAPETNGRLSSEERPPLAEPTSTPEPAPKKPGKPPSQTQKPEVTAAANPTPNQGPIDLSDIIAQTSVELKRLGWTNEQGRTYLQQTYGKRSRQQLTDDELLDFLHHLQAQPLSDEPSF